MFSSWGNAGTQISVLREHPQSHSVSHPCHVTAAGAHAVPWISLGAVGVSSWLLASCDPSPFFRTCQTFVITTPQSISVSKVMPSPWVDMSQTPSSGRR